jgi:hypothetical protein
MWTYCFWAWIRCDPEWLVSHIFELEREVSGGYPLNHVSDYDHWQEVNALQSKCGPNERVAYLPFDGTHRLGIVRIMR